MLLKDVPLETAWPGPTGGTLKDTPLDTVYGGESFTLGSAPLDTVWPPSYSGQVVSDYTGLLYNCQGGSTSSLDGTTHVDMVDFIILSSFKLDDNHALRTSLKTANPRIKILGYKTMADLKGSGTDTPTYRRDMNAGVTIVEALAHDAAYPADPWILRSSSGAILVGSDNYVGDISRQSYRDRWVANVLDMLSAYQCDGVFVDNTLADYILIAGGIRSPLYPTQLSWENAVVAFVADAFTRIRNAGYYVLANMRKYIDGDGNSDNGVNDSAYQTRLAPYVDGAMLEYWTTPPASPSHTRLDQAGWADSYRGWQALVAHAQQLGIDFCGLNTTPGGSDPWYSAIYGRAAFLLDWTGGSSGGCFCFNTGSGTDAYSSKYAFQCGMPLGPKNEIQASVFRRFWSQVFVLLNAHPTVSYTITQSPDGRPYTDPLTNAAVVYPYTVPAGRAVIWKTTSGGGGGEPPTTPQKTSVYTDNFNDGTLASQWTAMTASGATVQETGGGLRITMPLNAGVYAGVSLIKSDLVASAMSCSLAIGSTFTNGNQEAEFQAKFNSENWVEWNVIYNGSAQVLRALKKDGGNLTVIGTINPYLPGSTHKFLRIREASGTVYFDTSPDASTWTNRFSTTVTFDLSNITVSLDAGQDGASVPAIDVTFDDFNVLPVASYDAMILAEPALVAYYKLNEAVGASQALDSKGTRHSTAKGSSVVFGEPGLIENESDTCAKLVGDANSTITFPALGIASGSWAAEMWFKLIGVGSVGATDWGCLFGSAWNARFQLNQQSVGGPNDKKVLPQFGGNVNTMSNSRSEEQYANPHTRVHLVLEYDSVAGKMNLYINGVPDVIIPCSAITLNTVWWIGNYETPIANYVLNGYIQKVAFYNALLGGNKVAEHYANGTT